MRRQALVRRTVEGPLYDLLFAGKGLRGWLVTVGPPGERDHRRLDPRLDGKWLDAGARVPCSCHLWLDDGMGAWNARSGRAWNRFLTSLRREYPGLEFWSGQEPQDGKRRADGHGRMGLHRHTVVTLPSGGELSSHTLQLLAVRAGFGCSVDVELVRSVGVAAYVAKRVAAYVTKTVDDRALVPWEVPHPASADLVATRATYRRHSQSRGWGLTAAALSREIRDQHRRRMDASRVPPTDEDWAEYDVEVSSLFRRGPPPADPEALARDLLARVRSVAGLVGRLPRPQPTSDVLA